MREVWGSNPGTGIFEFLIFWFFFFLSLFSSFRKQGPNSLWNGQCTMHAKRRRKRSLPSSLIHCMVYTLYTLNTVSPTPWNQEWCLLSESIEEKKKNVDTQELYCTLCIQYKKCLINVKKWNLNEKQRFIESTFLPGLQKSVCFIETKFLKIKRLNKICLRC